MALLVQHGNHDAQRCTLACRQGAAHLGHQARGQAAPRSASGSRDTTISITRTRTNTMPTIYAYVLATPRTSSPECSLVASLPMPGSPRQTRHDGRVHVPRGPTRADTHKTRWLTTSATNALIFVCERDACFAIFRFVGLWRSSQGAAVRYDGGASGGRGAQNRFSSKRRCQRCVHVFLWPRKTSSGAPVRGMRGDLRRFDGRR